MSGRAGEPDSHVLVVTTTVGSKPAATRLARLLIEQRLAACVQIDAEILSLYRWEGRVCEEPETRLVIKTDPACEPALRAFLAEHHPYEVPQFVAMQALASPGYARWVRAEVAPPGPGGAALNSG